jgi:hypothetical protein
MTAKPRVEFSDVLREATRVEILSHLAPRSLILLQLMITFSHKHTSWRYQASGSRLVHGPKVWFRLHKLLKIQSSS